MVQVANLNPRRGCKLEPASGVQTGTCVGAPPNPSLGCDGPARDETRLSRLRTPSSSIGIRERQKRETRDLQTF